MKTKIGELDGLRRRLLVHRNDKDSVVAFVISKYIRFFFFAIVVFYFESSLQFQFLKKNYVGGVYSEENRTFLKVKTRRYRLID